MLAMRLIILGKVPHLGSWRTTGVILPFSSSFCSDVLRGSMGDANEDEQQKTRTSVQKTQDPLRSGLGWTSLEP